MIIRVFLFLLVFSGCSSNFRPPHFRNYIPIPSSYTLSLDMISSSIEEMGCWWKRFNEPDLNILVKKVIKNNLDIKIASIRLLEAKAKVMKSSSYLFPEANLSFETKRSRQNYEYEIPTRGKTTVTKRYTSYIFGLDVSYEVDLWKKVRDIKASSEAELLMSQEEKRTLIQSLICETISLYLKLAYLYQTQQLLERRLNIKTKTKQIVTYRFKKGKTEYDILLDCKNSIEEIKKEIINTKEKLNQTHQDLFILLGEYPERDKMVPEIDIMKIDIWPIQAGLPADLIMRRPDIRAKISHLKAKFLLKESSKASFFPALTLTGNLGYMSDKFKTLFSTKNLVWNIASAILQPIFKGGRLTAEYKIAKFQYKEEVIECAKTILNAFKEVERGLLNWEMERKREVLIKNQLKNLKEKLFILRLKFRRGLIDIIKVLETEDELYALQQKLIQTKLNILLNYIYLYKSLGGDWDKKCL